jgi:drug/metabolite transporter (DMT)-like permease
MATEGRDDRSLGELFSELSRETGTLIRKEVELATTEMTAKAKVAGGHVGMVAAGGALAHAGLLVLIALAQLGITPWLAAVIVGVLTIGIGYMLTNMGLAALRHTSVAPTQAIEAMKENSRWTTKQRA